MTNLECDVLLDWHFSSRMYKVGGASLLVARGQLKWAAEARMDKEFDASFCTTPCLLWNKQGYSSVRWLDSSPLGCNTLQNGVLPVDNPRKICEEMNRISALSTLR